MNAMAKAGSDLGRRLGERRRQLGLSVELVAAGASIYPRYLEYLESAPDPDPTRATLLRLAMALQTTMGALSGAGKLAPPDGEPVEPRAVLEPLSPEECTALISPGGVGRFVFMEGRGPVAVPVNYRMLEGDIVFRTAATTSLAARAAQRRVSFEVDHLDEDLSEGWSVLLSGEARLVEDAAELTDLRALGVRPWAAGPRDRYYRLHPMEVTGRRIRALAEPGP